MSHLVNTHIDIHRDRGASLLEVPDLTKDNDDDPVPDTVQYVQKKSVKQSSGQKSKSSSGGTCPVSPYNYVFYNRIPKVQPCQSMMVQDFAHANPLSSGWLLFHARTDRSSDGQEAHELGTQPGLQ